MRRQERNIHVRVHVPSKKTNKSSTSSSSSSSSSSPNESKSKSKKSSSEECTTTTSTSTSSTSNTSLELKTSNLNVSAGGFLYENAKSRRQRHRLALMSSSNHESLADAVPLGTRSKSIGGSSADDAAAAASGKRERDRGSGSTSRGLLVLGTSSRGPGRTADLPRDIARNKRIRDIPIVTGNRRQIMEQEEEDKVRELIECGRRRRHHHHHLHGSGNNSNSGGVVAGGRASTSTRTVMASTTTTTTRTKSKPNSFNFPTRRRSAPSRMTTGITPRTTTATATTTTSTTQSISKPRRHQDLKQSPSEDSNQGIIIPGRRIIQHGHGHGRRTQMKHESSTRRYHGGGEAVRDMSSRTSRSNSHARMSIQPVKKRTRDDEHDNRLERDIHNKQRKQK